VAVGIVNHLIENVNMESDLYAMSAKKFFLKIFLPVALYLGLCRFCKYLQGDFPNCRDYLE